MGIHRGDRHLLFVDHAGELEEEPGAVKGFELQRTTERKVEQAEAAFDRAMGGAGGVNFTRADAKTINAVAELDSMQKSSSVKDRLAALKAEAAGKAA